MGVSAERLVQERIAAALPNGARLYPNVRFIARTRAHGPAHDGEADLVIVHPDNGLLIIEVKGGAPSRDARGRWFVGKRELPRSPYAQAEAAKHDLRQAIEALPGWPIGHELRTGHAVAFPDVDLASLPAGHVLLGPDAPRDITFDIDDLAYPASARRALDRAWALWVADGSRGHPLDGPAMVAIDEFLAPTVELRRLLRHQVDDDRARLIRASNAQLQVLNFARNRRRVEVVGPAGSGKSLVAVEKACRLAIEGWRTLYVCFNQALATAVMREVEGRGEPQGRRPAVSTFHRLAETLAARAGLLGPKPANPGPEWFDGLAANLVPAIEALSDVRYDAIVIDEGQDFAADWLLGLELLLQDPDHSILWVFHDPGQALYRDDVVGALGLEPFELFEDYRSPAPVAALAARFYRGPGEPTPMSEGGLAPVVMEADPGPPTVEAVRRELHRVVAVEGVRPWDVVVLSGRPAVDSEVWRQRRFGNLELWNGAIDDAGRSKGLPGELVPDEPADDGVVLFETIRRFKGLERAVAILCELQPDADRLDALLYTALTRATVQLIVIAPPVLAARLRRPAGPT